MFGYRYVLHIGCAKIMENSCAQRFLVFPVLDFSLLSVDHFGRSPFSKIINGLKKIIH